MAMMNDDGELILSKNRECLLTYNELKTLVTLDEKDSFMDKILLSSAHASVDHYTRRRLCDDYVDNRDKVPPELKEATLLLYKYKKNLQREYTSGKVSYDEYFNKNSVPSDVAAILDAYRRAVI